MNGVHQLLLFDMEELGSHYRIHHWKDKEMKGGCSMDVQETVFCEKGCLDVNLEACLPAIEMDGNAVKLILISEALPKNYARLFLRQRAFIFL
jgi:hypothetical protein